MQTQLTSAVKKAPGAPFVRVKPGVFGLLRYPEAAPEPVVAVETPAVTSEEKPTETAEARGRRRRRGGRGRRRYRRGDEPRVEGAQEAAKDEVVERQDADSAGAANADEDGAEEPDIGSLSA